MDLSLIPLRLVLYVTALYFITPHLPGNVLASHAQTDRLGRFLNSAMNTRKQRKTFLCSRLPCLKREKLLPVCACNFKTGKSVSFPNECAVRKHNCRHRTDFSVILDEYCPWEKNPVESRQSDVDNFDYSNSDYYNNNSSFHSFILKLK